jgi:hypothetical protein
MRRFISRFGPVAILVGEGLFMLLGLYIVIAFIYYVIA